MILNYRMKNNTYSLFSFIDRTFGAFIFVGIPCNNTSTGTVWSSGMGPAVWTMYSGLFTATSSNSRIRFSSATDQSNKDWYVDGVSVIQNGSTGLNSIINGNFENGSSIGWNVLSCSSSCYASITTSSTCLGGSGWCYNNACTPSTNIQFLEQYFTTAIGATYNITFWLLKSGGGVGSGTFMSVNVF